MRCWERRHSAAGGRTDGRAGGASARLGPEPGTPLSLSLRVSLTFKTSDGANEVVVQVGLVLDGLQEKFEVRQGHPSLS